MRPGELSSNNKGSTAPSSGFVFTPSISGNHPFQGANEGVKLRLTVHLGNGNQPAVRVPGAHVEAADDLLLEQAAVDFGGGDRRLDQELAEERPVVGGL